MGISVGLFPANTLMKLQRRPSLAFDFGSYYWGLRRPLYQQSRQSLSLSPTVWADFGALLAQKTKLPRLTKVCRENPTLCPNDLFGGNEK